MREKISQALNIVILNVRIHEIKEGENNFGKYLTRTLHQDNLKIFNLTYLISKKEWTV